jgi:hypothetical protein
VRRSGRYAVAKDGAITTDKESMQKAMHRKAARNLDVTGPHLLSLLSIFLCHVFLLI